MTFWRLQLVSYPRNSRYFVAIKMGVSETVRAGLAARGSYLNRYVTDEQRSRGTIFVATLWPGTVVLRMGLNQNCFEHQLDRLRGYPGGNPKSKGSCCLRQPFYENLRRNAAENTL